MKNPLARIKAKIKEVRGRKKTHRTQDRVNLQLWGLSLTVSRETTSAVPAELTVVIPRAEFRTGWENNGNSRGQAELILSSITVVIAPRHPTEHGTGAAPPTLPG